MDRIVNFNLIEDYCDGTTLYVAPEYCGVVEISAEADLTPITATGYYKPGAIAHLAGWGAAWQFDSDSEDWTVMGMSDAQIEEAVDAWLTAHPEATTTVEDGAISYAKLNSSLKGTVDDVGTLKTAISDMETATSLDVGKALSPKTVTNGKVTEWQYKVIGGGGGGAVDDVQINGTSIVDANGVANIPMASANDYGVVKVGYGIQIKASALAINPATSNQIKAGNVEYHPVCASAQHAATFYGLAKAAGDSTQSASSNAVGTYTEAAKSAIHGMLDAPETVSGSTPSITAKAGVRYICGEVSTLAITIPASGIIDVVFTSGTTPTVLTVTPPTGMTMKWANGFDPTSLDASTTYEINIADGVYGVVASWT